MARSKSSARWLREHFSDPFVKKAKSERLRSRATFKLEALIGRDRILKPGMRVVDLGAAPGGWAQRLRQHLGDRGYIIALDILPMRGIEGVDVITGDFGEEKIWRMLENRLHGQKLDLVLSDMAPNICGVAVTDQMRVMHLAELALDFSRQWLKPGGSFLVKLFQGIGFDGYLRGLHADFRHVTLRKPEASRVRSREIYALASERK